ncbi:hypothetical protein [Streptacidiphilus jiangxiensis]|uniref:Uncharacterized protein n=1 Tax=Streptacidiphilus jiangxiensis TaxID=235985 RepID=A0A1H7ZXN8_STRJI|nr:hypothetical protein [Streptacidiphilus jiangxiensis]SEM62077.1 hypothetical protein SAMN05414137_13815 [Streptacidiphilus jiangxiensis]
MSARLLVLHALGRRAHVALLVIAGCALGLRLALLGHWDAYGALQLPLIFETAAAVAVAAATASPFGEPERVAGRWLPHLRVAVTLTLTAAAVGLLATAGLGGHLADGTAGVLRNVTGITGIGLLCAAALGGGLSWTGPTGFLVAALYALYARWHPPGLTTPLLWPARPPHDLGGALCAGLVFAGGLTAATLRGARDRPTDPDAA